MISYSNLYNQWNKEHWTDIWCIIYGQLRMKIERKYSLKAFYHNNDHTY